MTRNCSQCGEIKPLKIHEQDVAFCGVKCAEEYGTVPASPAVVREEEMPNHQEFERLLLRISYAQDAAEIAARKAAHAYLIATINEAVRKEREIPCRNCGHSHG